MIASISASKPDNQIAFDPKNGLEFSLVDERGDVRNITANRSLEASPIFNKQSVPNDLTAPISFISQQLEVDSKDIHDGDKLRSDFYF